MINQNFRGDFIVAQTFYRSTEDDSGAVTKKQVAVPDHVIVDFYTSPTGGHYICERNGDVIKSCSVSSDGMTLYCNVALSRNCIGTGKLYRNTIEVESDAAFPGGLKYIPSPELTDINLYTGVSDDAGSVETEVVLTLMRYGYSAYQLAVLNGYTGTETEWLDSLRGGGTDASLSETSTNPVQNKVITTALAGKQDTLTWDSEPTEGSSNAISSGAVYTAIDSALGDVETLLASI